MKSYLLSFLLLPLTVIAQDLPQDPIETIRIFGATIDTTNLNLLGMQDRGRIKPFQTFARETSLFLTGKYSMFDLDPVRPAW